MQVINIKLLLLLRLQQYYSVTYPEGLDLCVSNECKGHLLKAQSFKI